MLWNHPLTKQVDRCLVTKLSFILRHHSRGVIAAYYKGAATYIDASEQAIKRRSDH